MSEVNYFHASLLKLSCLLRIRSRELLERPFSCYEFMLTAKFDFTKK